MPLPHERDRVFDSSVPYRVLRRFPHSHQPFPVHSRWDRPVEERVLRLIGTSEGGSANDAYRISGSLEVLTSYLLINRL